MTEQAWAITWAILVTLLPLAPSLALYKILPSTGDLEGPWKGFKVKFSGAVACYLVIFFTLLETRPTDPNHFHTWTVRGTIVTQPAVGEDDPNLNDLFVRFVPPRLGVLNQGAFEWEIPVADGKGFPSLQLDLKDFRGLTVPLGPTGAYGSIALDETRDERARMIVIRTPLTLVSAHAGKAYQP